MEQPKKTPQPTRARLWVPVILLCLVGLGSAALLHVWVRLQQIEIGYQLSQARQESHRLNETQKRLRLEAALLKRPARIERIARERLGMTAPDPNQIHIIRVPQGRAPQRRSAPVVPSRESTRPTATATAAVVSGRGLP